MVNGACLRGGLGLVLGVVVTLASGRIGWANPALQGYADYATFVKQVQALDESDLVSVKSIGISAGGREIWAITVGKGEAEKHPAIAILGSTEGGNLVGAELTMRALQQLVAKAKEKPETAAWLEQYTLYVIPRPEPDSLQKAFQDPKRLRSGNDTLTDDDRDFAKGEDPPEDLDGDGWITQMRVEDPTGSYLPHPLDPRLMVTAELSKQERGKYRVYTEGIDNDQDGQWNEDAGDGEVFLRNFPHGYKPFVAGSGSQAASAPEVRAVIDFLFDRPNVQLVYSFASGENLWNPPKPNPPGEQGRMKTSVLGADIPVLDFLSGEYKKVFAGQDAPAVAPEQAGFANWAYFQYGRVSLVSRGWVVKLPELAAPMEAKKEGEGKPAEKPAEEKRGMDERKWLSLFGEQKREGYSNWTKVEHPDFPGQVVEVGGFRPFFQAHPPASELDGWAGKQLEFVSGLFQHFPKLSLEGSKAEALGGGIVRITMKGRNTGVLSTMTEMGQIGGEPYPLQAKVVGLPADTQFLVGSPRMRMAKLEGLHGKGEKVWLIRLAGEVPETLEISLEAPSVLPARATLKVQGR